MTSRPNIVLIMTDQQRADLCARELYRLDTTPFLDGLARGGAWFDRAYTPSPACAPARVSLLTGRFPSATRVRTNHNIGDARYGEDLVDVLKAAGYATALVGKNHSHLKPDRMDHWRSYGHLNGPVEGRTDEERRFDEWLGSLGFHFSPQPAPFGLEAQLPWRIIRDSIAWIDSRPASDPFFLWMSFPEPHNPYQVPEPYYSLFAPEDLPPLRAGREALAAKGYKFRRNHEMAVQTFPGWDEDLPRMRANYHGMLRLVDDQVARFVDHLERTGRRENTLLVFLADHGDFAGEYGMMRKGSEVAEALMRVPMLWNGPGVVPCRMPLPAHISLVDVLPTLCEMIGAPIPAGAQGRSLWPLLNDRDYPTAEFATAYAEQGFGGLHYTDADEGRDDLADPLQDGVQPGRFYDCLNSRTQSGSLRMLRKGDWKLAFDMMGRGQLYHLRRDPAELQNLFDHPDCAAVQMELMKDLLAWAIRAEDPLPYPRTRYVVKRTPRGWYAGEDRCTLETAHLAPFDDEEESEEERRDVEGSRSAAARGEGIPIEEWLRRRDEREGAKPPDHASGDG